MAFYDGSFKKIVIYLRLLKQLESMVHWFLFWPECINYFQTCVGTTMSYNQRKFENVACIDVLNFNLFSFFPHCKNMIKTIWNIE
jgi:hypothetical protein